MREYIGGVAALVALYFRVACASGRQLPHNEVNKLANFVIHTVLVSFLKQLESNMHSV